MIKNSPHIEQWNKCLQYLKDNLSTEQYNAWFAPISVVDFKDGALTLRVPSQFFIEQIEERYCTLMSSTLRKVYGSEFKKLYYMILFNTKENLYFFT